MKKQHGFLNTFQNPLDGETDLTAVVTSRREVYSRGGRVCLSWLAPAGQGTADLTDPNLVV
jgi:hypothetical protein